MNHEYHKILPSATFYHIPWYERGVGDNMFILSVEKLDLIESYL